MKTVLSVLLFALLGVARSSLACDPIVLKKESSEIWVVNEYLEVFEDKHTTLGLHQVAHEAWKDSFTVWSESRVTNNHPNSTYWLRFSISNESDETKKWLLEMFDHHINLVSLYEMDHDTVQHEYHSGNNLTFAQRHFEHKNVEFDVNIPLHQKRTYYLKIKSENQNVLAPVLRSYERFVSYALVEYYLLGLFYGILVIIAVYNMLLYLSLRRFSYLFYVCHVLSVSLYTMCQNGLAFAFLWPDHPSFNRFSSELSIYFATLFSVLFTKTFLRLPEQFPVLNRIINILLVARACSLALACLFYTPAIHYQFLDLIPLTVAYGAVLHSFWKRENTSYYFGLALTLVYITFVVTILEDYGMIWSGIVTVYSLNIGIVLEIVFLSFSLAEQMRNEVEQREEAQWALVVEMREKELLSQKVNRELEEKVRQRTEELNEANNKLKKQVEDTTSMNLKLDLINWNLKKNVTEIARKRIVKPIADYNEFLEVYSSESACFRFLNELKENKPFVCKKCSSGFFGKGKDTFDRRCTKCGYNESITANTLYHKVKFPIVKAFYITHIVFTRHDITAEELSELVSLRKETCSFFKRKILQRIKGLDKKELSSWDALVLNDVFQLTED